MMGALADNLMGVVIGEATGQGQGRGGRVNVTAEGIQQAQQRQQQRHRQWNSQQQQRPLANLADSVTDLCNRALHATLKVPY